MPARPRTRHGALARRMVTPGRAVQNQRRGFTNKPCILTNGLEVDTQRMLQNLELTKGLIYAENLSLALAEKMGESRRTRAH